MPDAIRKTNPKTLIMWICVIAAPIIVMLIPTQGVFTPQLRTFSAITLTAILLFAFNILPNFVVAVALPVSYMLLKVAEPNIAFAAWFSNIPWMFMGGFLLANVLERIGLLNRVAFWSIIKTGGTYSGILWGLAIAGIILNLIAPGKAYVPMAALSFGICKALNFEKSRESAGIMMGGFFASWFPTFFLYNPTFAIMPSLGKEVAPVQVTWIQYFINNIPFVLWLAVCIFMVIKLCKPKKQINIKDYAIQEYSKLGKVSLEEKKSLIVVSLLFIFMFTSDLHGIDVGWGFALIPLLFFIPGINVGKPVDISKINFTMAIFTTACLSIGHVANSLGIGQIIADAVLPLLQGKSVFFVIGAVWLVCVVAKIFLTPLATYATLTVPLTQIALSLGISPLVIYYTMNLSTTEILFPYQWALVLIFMGYNLTSGKDFTRIWGTKMILSFVFALAIAVPYWMLIGLI
ncbi:SLC13 family permease [Eubacterium maltosivorans]|uniref:SLC13 family permease n=1 Tax=Eubacterium maltosivorans TaxID=2041044 RepID=UPI0018A0DCBB|nr:SLC13 family permease [Eubacterium maltosivorans]